MDSAERLRQLREQRDLVQRHLQWLDAEIARAADAEPSMSSQPTPADPVPREELPAAPLDDAIAPAPAQNARNQKLGCIIATVLVSALALFLFWGLPQLIYSD